MNVLVLGAGLQGTACAFDLLQHTTATVTLADRSAAPLPRFLSSFAGRRLRQAGVDARDPAVLRQIISGHTLVLSALPYYLNVEAATAAVEAGAHFADLGGNTDIVRQQERLHETARRRGVSVVPDCGVAPGLVNILAVGGIERVGRAESVRLFVGGLPQRPSPPLNYSIVYSLEGVLDYYTTPSWILRQGKPVEVEALSEVETVSFPAPVGRLEAFHTAGGVSTMPWTYQGRLVTLEYKTLRYPGHAEIMRAVRGLGLLDLEPVNVKGKPVVPRDAFIAVVDPRLRRHEPDLIALRVEVAGTRDGRKSRITFELLDRADEDREISAMMRTTGYSLSITGQLQLSGAVAPGVRPSYEAVPFQPYLDALKERGIKVREIVATKKGKREAGRGKRSVRKRGSVR